MFIMVHPELAFSLFEALLDGPPHDGGLAHLREKHIEGGVGKGEFRLSIGSVSDKEPYRVLLGQSLSGG